MSSNKRWLLLLMAVAAMATAWMPRPEPILAAVPPPVIVVSPSVIPEPLRELELFHTDEGLMLTLTNLRPRPVKVRLRAYKPEQPMTLKDAYIVVRDGDALVSPRTWDATGLVWGWANLGAGESVILPVELPCHEGKDTQREINAEALLGVDGHQTAVRSNTFIF